jgi:hypothetical protein
VYEGLAHLKAVRADGPERVQACLAQASAHQLDPATQHPVVAMLLQLVDLVCCMHAKNPLATAGRLRRLQALLDGTDAAVLGGEVLLPVKKHAGTGGTLSEETAAIVRPGGDGREHDFMVVAVPNQLELYGLL